MRAFLREFFSDLDAPNTPTKRLRTAAIVRLAMFLPLVLLPTGLGLTHYLPAASEPRAATILIEAWFALFIFIVLTNVGVLLVVRANRPDADRVLRVLTYLILTAELGTNQISAHCVGSLTSNGGVYIVLAIAIYRVFFDYRLALYATILGSAGYVASVVLGHLGLVPHAPLLATFDHPFYIEGSTAVPIVVTAVVAFLLAFFAINYGANQSVKLHRYITESVLRRYLPPSLVARAAVGELRLDGEPERRVVTVMFTDIVGFTALAERLGADQVGRLLNAYLSQMADLAHGFGATVDKFVGDAVMIVFGAPDELAPEDQARRCVALAQAMQAALAGEHSGLGLQIRAGINTGEAVAGHFGSPVRSDFTVIGHTVNVAARLESASAPGRILVSEETARYLGDEVSLEPAGELPLKNVSVPVRAFFVTGGATASDRPQARGHLHASGQGSRDVARSRSA